MKKMMFTLIAMLTIAVSANAMSYEQARNEALFLTDKMAYELNLSDAQYEAAYEINLDYLMGVTSQYDVFGPYWERRNLDLSYILFSWQWDIFRAATYFYRPLIFDAGYWHFSIYARYPHRDYFFFGRPHFYATYRGGHSWRMNSGRSFYEGRRDFYRPGNRTRDQHFGMRNGWDRGDYRGNNGGGPRSSTHVTGGNNGGNENWRNNGGFGSGRNMNPNDRSAGGMNSTRSTTPANGGMQNQGGFGGSRTGTTNSNGNFGGNRSGNTNGSFGGTRSGNSSDNFRQGGSTTSPSAVAPTRSTMSRTNPTTSGSFGGNRATATPQRSTSTVTRSATTAPRSSGSMSRSSAGSSSRSSAGSSRSSAGSSRSSGSNSHGSFGGSRR